MGMLRKSLLGVQPQETFEPLVIPPTDQLQSMGQGGHCSFIRRGVKPVYLCGLVDQDVLDSRRSDFSNCQGLPLLLGAGGSNPGKTFANDICPAAVYRCALLRWHVWVYL